MTSPPRLVPPLRRRIPLKGAALFAFIALSCAFLAMACGSSNGGNGNGNGASDASFGTDAPNLVGDNETIFLNPGDGSPAGDAGSYSDVLVIPENFVPTEFGGYALGPPTNGGGADAGLVQNGNASNCSLVVGIVRDFPSYQIQAGGHPDFERFNGSGTKGLVQSAIGSDRKPVYAGICDDNGAPQPSPCPDGQQLTTKANFDEWYRYTAGVNDPYLVYLQFVKNGSVYTFESNNYFPLDNAGFGNTPQFNHNFSFTTELHLKFTYNGGETFAFSGDDDLWVFINGTLAIDLGGLHSPLSQTVSLDNLGLTKGSTYDIELFNAERHSTGSNFRVDTNLSFSNCGTIPPDNPPK